MPTIRRGRLIGAAAAALVAIAAGVTTYAAGAWERLEGDSVDLRFSWRTSKPPSDVVVVAIDDVTFSELQRQWPFRRSLHALAIDRLRRAGARRIVYDVQFTEPSSPRQDRALYEAVDRARRVVLATTEVDDHGHTNVLGGDANLARADAQAGASNLPSSRGGVIRRVTYSVSGLRTLAAAVTEDLKGERLPRSLFERGGALIDYRGPPGAIPTVSFSKLIRGEAHPQLFRGKVVVVGASAPTLQDVHPAPTSSRTPMSGPEIQANAIWTGLHGFPLRDAPRWLDLLAIGLLGALVPLLGALGSRLLRLALAAPVAGAAYVVLAKVAFDSGTVIALTYPLFALAAGTIATVAVGYLTESRERRRVSRYSDRLEREVRVRTQELRETQLEIVRRLAQAAESRHKQTGAHIERIGRLCYLLGRSAGMSRDEAELLRDASALHDVGKIGIPDSILLKTGALTDAERELMMTHTTIDGQILGGSQWTLIQTAEQIALTHHERWDGTGYPAGLEAEQIPLVGRICAICDVFDALMSERPYKEAWSFDDALAAIRAERGRAFDPRLVDLFSRIAFDLDRERKLTDTEWARAGHDRPALRVPTGVA